MTEHNSNARLWLRTLPVHLWHPSFVSHATPHAPPLQWATTVHLRPLRPRRPRREESGHRARARVPRRVPRRPRLAAPPWAPRPSAPAPRMGLQSQHATWRSRDRCRAESQSMRSSRRHRCLAWPHSEATPSDPAHPPAPPPAPRHSPPCGTLQRADLPTPTPPLPPPRPSLPAPPAAATPAPSTPPLTPPTPPADPRAALPVLPRCQRRPPSRTPRSKPPRQALRVRLPLRVLLPLPHAAPFP